MATALSDILFTSVSFSAAAVLALVSGVLAARLLGPAGRGELAAIQLIPGFLVILAGMGGFQSIVYYSAKDPNEPGEILGSSLAASLLACIPVCVVGFFLQSRELASYSPSVRVAGYLFLAYIPLNILNSFPWSTFAARRQMREWNLLRIQPQLAYCATIVFAWCFDIRNPMIVTNSYLLLIIFVCVPSTWFLYHTVVGDRLKAVGARIKKNAPYGLISMLNYFPGTLNQRVDQAMIGAILPWDQLGFYAVAVSWAGILNIVVSAVAANLLPRVAARNGENASGIFLTALRWTAPVVLLISAVLVVITPLALTTLFGKRFADAVLPAKILLLAGIFASLNMVFGDGYRGLGRPSVPLAAEFVGLVATAFGLYFGLRQWGIVGASWISVASYASTTAVYVGCLPSISANPFGDWIKGYSVEGRGLMNALLRRRIAS